MPVLAARAAESFAIQFANAGSCVWVLSYTERREEGVANLESRGCAQGTATSAGTIAVMSIFSAPSAPPNVYSRELQFCSIHNTGTADQVAAIGKLSIPAPAPAPVPGLNLFGTSTAAPAPPVAVFYQFSASTTIHPGETLVYVQGNGFTVFDPIGLPKSSSAHS